MKKLLYLSVFFILLFSIVSCSDGSAGTGFDVWSVEDPDRWTSNGKWTVMVWLDGDNNLESASMIDLNEMEYGLYLAQTGNPAINDNLSIIVQIDRIDGYLNGGYDGGVDWSNTRRYRVKPDSNTSDDMIRSLHLANMEETNMGDASNLKDFITYCKANYPADNYALILWNHGGGVRGTPDGSIISKSLTKSSTIIEPDPAPKAVCWDDTDSGDSLYVGEITDVLTDSEDVTLLGFDACLMGMAEIAYEYRHGETGDGEFGAKYMAASAATEQGDGWEYQKIFNRFSGSGSVSDDDPCYDVSSVSGSIFAEIIVEEYKDAFSGDSGETMAAYDLDKIDEVKTALDNLASVLDDSADYKTASETARDNTINYFDESDVDDWISYPHFDMWDYADNVGTEVSVVSSLADDLKTAVSSCVISSWGNEYPDYDYPDSTAEPYGLGFFYPDGDYSDSDYSNLYYYEWWYTAEYTNSWWSGGHYYGNLDFCSSDDDGNVEGWRELLEYWFDNGTDYTPSSY